MLGVGVGNDEECDTPGLWLAAEVGGDIDDGRSIGADEDEGGLERCFSLCWIASGVELILIGPGALSDVGEWNGWCICCGIGANGCDGGWIGALNPGCGARKKSLDDINYFTYKLNIMFLK